MEEIFAGDISNIYINPNEISMNLQTNKMESVVKPSQNKESILELANNIKGNHIFNFTKELESMETPEQSPIPEILNDNWDITLKFTSFSFFI